jgi:hypothetical protein
VGCARACVCVCVCVCVAQTLGVPLGTSKADCKKAYFKLAKIWHPDKHQQVLSLPTLVGPFCTHVLFSRESVAALEGQLHSLNFRSFPRWRSLPRGSSIHQW